MPRILTRHCVAFIVGLLQNVGSHVDPIKLIQRIPKGLEIPELRNSLIKILQDYNLQVHSCPVFTFT